MCPVKSFSQSGIYSSPGPSELTDSFPDLFLRLGLHGAACQEQVQLWGFTGTNPNPRNQLCDLCSYYVT